MKIAVCHIYGENFSELAAISSPVVEKYCHKHGYDCFIQKVKPNEKGTYTYIKIQAAIDLIKSYDAALILEGDQIITNLNYKIETFIDDYHSFYLVKDINGVNTGSFIVRSTKKGKALLNRVWDNREMFEDEQNFFETFSHYAVKTLPRPSINSIPYDYYAPSYGKIGYKDGDAVEKPTHEQGCWQEGDFIMHIAGMTNEKRLEIFKQTQPLIKYD